MTKLARIAAALGLDLPRELSVVGFDSTDYCETTTPRLTAVRQPIHDMAACAANVLIDLIEGNAPAGDDSLPSSTLFPCSLDVRGSTARPLSAEEKS